MSVGRFSIWVALCVALGAAQGAFAQAGLRVPDRGEGIDPSFARGWLAPDYDRFGFAYYTPWRDASLSSSRMNLSYPFGRGSFGMSVANGRDFEPDRQSLFGRYSLTPDWAFSAEMSRDSTGARPQDFRFGVQRRF